MNKQRRKELDIIARELNDIKERLEALRDEEQDYYDNMPENLQGSERGEKAEVAIESLEEAASSIEDAISSIEEATEQ